MAFIPSALRPFELHHHHQSQKSPHFNTQYHRHYQHTPKRLRTPLTTTTWMNTSSNANSNNKRSELSDEDEKLQNDKPFMFREFGKVSLAAVVIGLVLFCFDILVSLIALSIGALYALAVLFNIRFITNFFNRILNTFNDMRLNLTKIIHRLWTSLRHQLSNE